MRLKLRKFDPAEFFRQNVACLLIGKRATGKSFLMKDLMFHLRDIPYGIVMSGTEEVNRFYGDMIAETFIYHEFEPAVLKKVIAHQKKRTVEQRERDALRERYRSDPAALASLPRIDNRMFVVTDDLLQSKDEIIKDKSMQFLMFNGRHIGCSTFMLVQYAVGISPDLRNNIDLVVILRENIADNRKKLYEMYAGCFPTRQVFEAAMRVCTDDFGALVINNRTSSTNLQDQAFWYKASDHGEFRAGWYGWELFEQIQRNPAALEDAHDAAAAHDDAEALLPKKSLNIHVHRDGI